jgi:hypothetical protein
MLPEAAPIVTVPAAEPLANPPALIDATLESDELHVTELLMSFVVLSERWAVATNCCVLPMPIDIDAGVTTSDVTDGVPPPPDEDDDCELLPEDTPPQPQLSDAKIKTAINVTLFMSLSKFAIRDARAHPAAFSSGSQQTLKGNRVPHSFPIQG